VKPVVLRVAAAVAAVAGATSVAVGLIDRPGGLQPGANDFVNDRNETPAKAHNSPSVAVDPRNPSTIVVANRLDAPDLACAVSVSTNAGATWRPLELPAHLAAPNCYWPRATFLPDGTLLVLSTDLVGPYLLPGALWLQRFEGGGDGMRAAGAPQPVAGKGAYHPRIAVSGMRVWLTWVQASPASEDNPLGFAPGDNPVVVARSTDGGRTFSPPVRLNDGRARVIQPTVVAGVGQTVTVGALDLGDDVLNYEATHDGETPPDRRLRWRVVAWTSLDDGATWGPTVTVAGDLPVPQLIIADLGPAPGFAADPRSGVVYATWDAGRGDDRDVFVASSGDGGRRWSAPVRVGPVTRSQLLPGVSVAPDGRVDVVFFDRSRDPQDRLQEVVAATSSDGGRTFRWAHVSDAASDSGVGLGVQQGVPVQGDSLGVLSRAEMLLAFWPDSGRGSPANTVQDLAVAFVEVGFSGGRRWGLVAVGVALVFAGAMLLGASRTPG
jgi:hypothetical protein